VTKGMIPYFLHGFRHDTTKIKSPDASPSRLI
jgi:hypothetical protein